MFGVCPIYQRPMFHNLSYVSVENYNIKKKHIFLLYVNPFLIKKTSFLRFQTLYSEERGLVSSRNISN